MFETSVVQAQAKAAGSRLRLLTVSVVAHSAVIIGIVATGIASVEFPTDAPDENAAAPLFVQVRIPPPLGNPNGGAKPQPSQPAPQKPAPQPNQVTAPVDVPENIPTLEPPSTPGTGEATGEATGTGTEPGPVGVPWGEEGGVGPIDGPPITTTMAPVEEKIYEAHEVKAPVPLFKPSPQYPPVLIRTKMRATVIVRCVIDRNGHVQDPQVIVPAVMPPFNESVLKTVRTWRYTPGSVNGKAVDSYLNVTVTFAVN
ncbi:MAG TPA: energy transducer TonB [Thermoanaerobaculia bacterium]|nr:energy transducer TonB [Thermoanaerobaculia bacterium]